VIALLGLRSPDAAAAETVGALLPVPCAYSGLVARCDSWAELKAVLDWTDAMRHHHRHFPLALVLPRNPVLLRAVIAWSGRVDAVLFVDELNEGEALPEGVLHALVEHGIAARLLARVRLVVPGADTAAGRGIVRGLVVAGVAGHGVESLCRAQGLSSATLRRRMGEMGMPHPKHVLKVVRVAGVYGAVAEGMEAGAAMRVAGWLDAAAFRSAAARVQRFAAGAEWARKLLALEVGTQAGGA
jgi:hypothetical protein